MDIRQYRASGLFAALPAGSLRELLNGCRGTELVLPNRVGFVNLTGLATRRGLGIASIEQEGEVKLRMLLKL